MDKYISYINPRQNMRGFIIGILILAGLGMGIGAAVVTSQPPREAPVEVIATKEFSSPNVFTYAYWAGEKSEVKSFDLSNGQEAIIATLPLNIKHIKLLSSSEIIYINDTDDKDYGSQIVVKSISNGQETIAVQASSDVRIDDYRVSPNGQYVATWEVSLPPDSLQLFNGISRVYVTDISTGVKNQIYSEVATTPVHYPIAVTNEGKVFMDTFLPNDSAGWAYGMSVSDFSGTNIQDITAVSNGTYGSQPEVSPDGTMLVFTGYDGSKGNGVDVVSGIRRALLSSNTVDVLDMNTLSRRRLSNLSTENLYSKAWWDSITGNVLLSQVSKDGDLTGTYNYNLVTNLPEKVNLESVSSLASGIPKVISVLSPGVVLAGSVTNSESTLGNLGGKYDQVLDGTFVINENESDIVSLDITGGFVQPIAVNPSSYFGSVGLFSSDSSSSGGIKNKQEEQLQLQTFTIKPTLAPVRTGQQSGERCRDVAAARCNELLGTNWSGDEAAIARTTSVGYGEPFSNCVKEQWTNAQQSGSCSDSPLYLYGTKGEKINVKVGTPVTETTLPYSPFEGFSGILTGDGGVSINGIDYPSIEFDYQLAGKVITPVNGVVIERKNLESGLRKYALNLGMNEKERLDFINYVKSETHSERIFISHFSNNVSKKLLPLYFTPEPDSYTNMVFYINDSGLILDSNPVAPKFEKIKREGFTAVEISYIISR